MEIKKKQWTENKSWELSIKNTNYEIKEQLRINKKLKKNMKDKKKSQNKIVIN